MPHNSAKITNICLRIMTTKTDFRRVQFSFLAWCLLCLLACNQDTDALVQEKVAERLVAFNAKKLQECQESLLQLAERKVDSLLLSEAQQALNDSLTKLRPGRPFQPANIPPIDSLSVKPIFKGIQPASRTGG